MGYILTPEAAETFIAGLAGKYRIYAPKRFAGGAPFSDLDCVRYGEVVSMSEVVFDEKSDYSFKEALLPLSETLFFFTEGETREAGAPAKEALIFLRSCDLHAVKRLDEIYLRNGAEDYYYKRLREKIKFVLMGCPAPFESCFCADMGTNRCDDYELSVEPRGGGYAVECRLPELEPLLAGLGGERAEAAPSYVTETPTRVNIPAGLTAEVGRSEIWREYDGRCINCGRCNFVCPTCSCYTMQDIFYSDNGRVGERRRVQASCMVDGFTDVAGGGAYRKKNGERMRFKTLHKIYDFKERFGYQMCVGCGRCDDICPEYISFSGCINRLEEAMKEVEKDVR
ncbi:MAG: anaerobic sulfite reductase subunit AsrA [Synergistaceae bacterium]|nr:anaerobic sulfite reductase subunit AsrA [Synergistaceae bacterium]